MSFNIQDLKNLFAMAFKRSASPENISQKSKEPSSRADSTQNSFKLSEVITHTYQQVKSEFGKINHSFSTLFQKSSQATPEERMAKTTEHVWDQTFVHKTDEQKAAEFGITVDEWQKVDTFIKGHEGQFRSLLDESGERGKYKFKPADHSDLPFTLVLFKDLDGRPLLRIASKKEYVGAGGSKAVLGGQDVFSQVHLVHTRGTDVNPKGMYTEKYVLTHPKLMNDSHVASAKRVRIVTLKMGASSSTEQSEFKMLTEQERAKGDLSKIKEETTYLKCIRDSAKGLASLHAEGIIHADVKDQNILFYENNGQVSAKIADFGSAILKNAPRNLNVRKHFRSECTPDYASPEAAQILQKVYESRAITDEILKSQGKQKKELLKKLKIVERQINDLNQHVTEKLDVWQLGTTLYKRFASTLLDPEIAEKFREIGLPPPSPWMVPSTQFRGRVEFNQEKAEEAQVLLKEEAQKLAESDPPQSKLLLLIADTLRINPTERPTMQQVASRLDEICGS